MRLVNADDIDDQIRQEFGIPYMVGQMDNPDAREAITILNIISNTRTIIPGKDDTDPALCYYIGSEPKSNELVAILRRAARNRIKHIGRKPKTLYDLSADCIERLTRGDDNDH